ncbi:ABC transporter ATP-binding protein [Thermoplasma sp.]|uniref:ABC transporter ATP-binding protein n=1 Tax=Thermoplasma sp. TaxID=1973142 RepID=UPI00262E5579|nr:ABC transporter ATP-binding protein [Thermoplasma sp.]
MIEVENLSIDRKTFRINGVSFSIVENGINGIGGLNGSGKTTVLKAIYGFLKPSGGAVYIDGKNISGMKPREIASMVSVVHQEQPTPMNFTVRDVVQLSGYSRGQGGPGLEECLEACGIDHLSDREFSTLSGGEKRIVMFAAAMYQNTRYILLDEPMTFLDVDKAVRVMSIIRRFREAGKTVVIVSHDINFLYNECDSVILMRSGSVLYQGDPRKVINEKTLYEVFNVKFGRYESAEGVRFYPYP